MASNKDLLKTRNIGIIAHIDAGKTTVTERVLYYAGKIHKIGEVHNGEATMDWMEQEKQRGITITSAITGFEWNNHFIHLIDTPGHVDFSIEVERSLRVLDGAVVVMCGVGGVEPQTENVWRQADRFRVPRIVFINKMDRAGADFQLVMKQITQTLKATPLPLYVPYFEEGRFAGIIDVLYKKCLVWDSDDEDSTIKEMDIPDTMVEEIAVLRYSLVEKLADFDDDVAEKYLSGEDLDNTMLLEVIKAKTLSLDIVPVFCGSALKNKGVKQLMAGVCSFLPSPLDIPVIHGFNEEGELVDVYTGDDNPFCALMFKVMTVEGRRMCFARIYSGTVSAGEKVYNSSQKNHERVARLFELHANRKSRTDTAGSGDIVAIMGLKDTMTGDTLCDESNPVTLEKIISSEPVISMVIEPKKNSDLDKLKSTLLKLADEDPNFHMREDTDTGQILISGMGELHLEVAVDRLRTEYGIEANVGLPKVVYRETIIDKGTATGLFDKKIGEKDHYGEVTLTVSPGEKDSGITVASDMVERVSDSVFQLIKQSLFEFSQGGVLLGYPVMDILITVNSVKSKEDSQSEIAFRAASMNAFNAAMKKASPILLEPVMEAEIITPEEFLGGVMGDLSTKGAQIINIDTQDDVSVITATIKLSKMFGYSRSIRSLTQGRCNFTMQFHSYEKSDNGNY